MLGQADQVGLGQRRQHPPAQVLADGSVGFADDCQEHEARVEAFRARFSIVDVVGQPLGGEVQYGLD